MQGDSSRTSGAASFAGTTLDPARGPAAADMTWLVSYQDVDEVFRSRDFEQGGGGRRDSEPFVGQGLLSLSGDDHFERRRVEAPLFRRPALRRYESDVLAPALRASLLGCAQGPDGVVRGELQRVVRLALCRVSATLVGIDGIDTPASVDRYLWFMDRLSAGVNIEWMSRDHREIIREGLEVRNLFDQELFGPSWRRREALVARYRAGEIGLEALPVDLLTIVLLNPEHFGKWGPDIAMRETLLFNGAPTNTITSAVPHVVQELSDWFTQHPEDRSRAEEADFLRKAIAEGLRLHPASPYLIRRAIRGTRLQSGRTVREGEYVVLDLVKASLDPAVFGPEPTRFDPHRVPLARIRPMGLAFGDGPHTCIGLSMSIGEAGASDEDVPLGLAVYILRELYRAGVRLDPAHPPRWNDANVRNEYAAFPVCFDRL
jgi:cytochrome P450